MERAWHRRRGVRDGGAELLRCPAEFGGFAVPAVGEADDVDRVLVRPGHDHGDLLHRNPFRGGQRPTEELFVAGDHRLGFGECLRGAFRPRADQLDRDAGDLGMRVFAHRCPRDTEGEGQLVA
jgi:hypothetical protein